jgi:tetratricopeptide (TPR) repeat protein/outer membrane protein assembly factor BamD (BamD/ComL family)
MTRLGAPKLWWLLVAVVFVATALSSCSPKKNNAATRKYQAFITRYNIYYNGDTHYKETLKEMETSYEDDYSSLVLIHPAVAKSNSKLPQPKGDFTRSIEKAQKAIQLRSIKKKPKKQAGKASTPEYKAWLKREEYNPFLHNAWMMMGRSQYLNGDFLGAAATFFYISKHFTWLPQTVTEAKLWEAHAYLAMDWAFEAETILRRIKPDQELDNGKLKGLYYTAEADLNIKNQDWDKASSMLSKAIPYVSKQQKIRLNFLLGQVYARAGKKDLAYKAYQAAGNNSSATYRTKFNARIQQSEVYTGQDITKEVNALKRMTRYDRNKEYLDQIYYAIGNLYLTRKDTTNAIANYELAVEKSTKGGINKALAQLTLGGLYYERQLYAKAQPCYSEAVSVIPDTYPNYQTIKRRSDVLDELAVYSQNVELQDSLLRLAAMTPEQQMTIINKIIDELKEKEKKEAEEAARQEYMANKDANSLNDQNTQSFQISSGDDSWYFYNTATKNAGKTAFQKSWGNRKLEDDWRRRNKQTFSFNDFGSDENQDGADDAAPNDSVADASPQDEETLKKEADPHFPEYYLKQIPKTDQEKQTSNDIIQEGLYNMGVILKDKMEDFGSAEHEFESLLTRYPDNIYRLDTYYNLYLMYMRMGETAKAEKYRQLILSDFADSKYGIALQDPDYIGSLRRMQQVEGQLYDQALEAYLNNDNGLVHGYYKKMSNDYPLSKLMPKFMFIEALAYVTDKKPEEFKSTLMTMLERYPNTDLTEYASAYLKGLAQGKKLQQGGSNMRGMIWDIKLGNDSTAVRTDSLTFELDPNKRQLLILLSPTDEINQNALLFEVARHNFSSFVVKDFDLEQMNFGRLGLLIIKGFENVNEINHYLKVLYASEQLKLPEQVRPVVISEKNFETLMQGGGSFEEYFQYMQDKMYNDTQERVLPSEFYEHEPEGVAPEEAPAEAPAKVDEAPAEVDEAPAEVDETNGTNEANETTETAEPEGIEVIPEGVEVEPEEPTPTAEVRPAEPPAEPEAPVETPAEPVKVETPAEPEKPAEPAKVETPTKPTLPDYPEGSEGDDPLFD